MLRKLAALSAGVVALLSGDAAAAGYDGAAALSSLD
jgi:hypothetical protein